MNGFNYVLDLIPGEFIRVVLWQFCLILLTKKRLKHALKYFLFVEKIHFYSKQIGYAFLAIFIFFALALLIIYY